MGLGSNFQVTQYIQERFLVIRRRPLSLSRGLIHLLYLLAVLLDHITHRHLLEQLLIGILSSTTLAPRLLLLLMCLYIHTGIMFGTLPSLNPSPSRPHVIIIPLLSLPRYLPRFMHVGLPTA